MVFGSKYYSKELKIFSKEINDVYKIYHSGDLKASEYTIIDL